LLFICGVCGEVHVEMVLVGGGYDTFITACQAVESKIPVLVIKGTGPAANFIADALNKTEQSVFKKNIVIV